MQNAGSLPKAQAPNPLRHWLAFLLSGGAAFSVDAIVLKSLTVLLRLNPIVARLFAISLAMLVGWLAHRTFTFALRAPPSLAEFVRYALVGWSAAAVNYGLFALAIVLKPSLEPLLALVLSSLAATVFAYLGMRYGAFRVARD